MPNETNFLEPLQFRLILIPVWRNYPAAATEIFNKKFKEILRFRNES